MGTFSSGVVSCEVNDLVLRFQVGGLLLGGLALYSAGFSSGGYGLPFLVLGAALNAGAVYVAWRAGVEEGQGSRT